MRMGATVEHAAPRTPREGAPVGAGPGNAWHMVRMDVEALALLLAEPTGPEQQPLRVDRLPLRQHVVIES